MRIGSLFKSFDDEEEKALAEIEKFVSKQRFKLIKGLLKEKKITIENFELSGLIADDMDFPQIKAVSDEVDASEVNNDIQQKVMKEVFTRFSKRAFAIIPQLISPNIKGMEAVKKAAALQLFSQQPIHILLLGDPGTGKTDLIRDTAKLSPVSSFGLGSGTTGVGLVATVKGEKVMKGLLPMADGGVCCIDELNLMKEESRAGLYSAMEKGFVTYDKGGHHHRFAAKAKILATANPKGDKFTGRTIDEIREEIPFDSALLTRFHLVFFITKPDLAKFKAIAEKITAQDKLELGDGDIAIIQSYIEYVMKIDVADISKPLQAKIVDFITELKQDEDKYLIEISPRQIIGIMRLCKALARMEARDHATEDDLNKVKELFRESLKIE